MRTDETNLHLPVYTKDGAQRIDTAREMFVYEIDTSDFREISQKTWPSSSNRSTAACHQITGGTSFWGEGIYNAQSLQDLLDRGWKDGATRCLELSEEVATLIPSPVGPRRQMRWSDQGDEIRMERVYSGELDRAWRSMPRQRGQGPRVISIDVDVGHHGGISASSLFWSGAGAVALTNALETAGYHVELFATACGSNRSGAVALTRARVKRSEDPMNIEVAAALVSHPATFRWYHLRTRLRSKTRFDNCGLSVRLKDGLDAAVESGMVAGSEVLLPTALTKEEAVANLRAAIEKLDAEQVMGEGVML